MGEYAEYNGQQVKIGTCEDMLYLRADQAHEVTALTRNIDPMNAKHREVIRFRFPFPEEDGIEPGAFEDSDRGHVLYSVQSPAAVKHSTVQFRADNGYLVSLPCPESGDRGIVSLASNGKDHAYVVHRNGHPGATELIQQAWRDGLLVSILKCKACGSVWRLPELEHAQPVIDALHKEADAILRRKGSEAAAVRLRSIADRVLAGYQVKVSA